MVKIPEMSDPMVLETVLEILSTSFVILDIKSPWACVSVYEIGNLTIFANKSFRSFLVVLMARRAPIKVVKY